MKNAVFVLVGLLLLVACAKEDLGMLAGALGQEVRLKQGQSVRYNTSPIEAAPILQVKLENVRDSRCPSDVVCVTYGQALAELRVGAGNGVGELVTLCLGSCETGFKSSDTANVVVNASAYRIILLDITPHPTLKQKSNTVKEAKLKVERL